ncbi:LysR family transcriptional regulator [Bacillus sp. Bva_UNVM-123]|uniref:LysR family transcriptional regulator n=1 Tax=Bacillus sp. Bva_UNVM-123 TaxID=2829798 RepID=UPI00391F6471
MNIEQIEAFLYVATTSSFSKAGEILYTTQPTISSRIKSLETLLSCQLFDRKGNNISLTEEGEAFLPHAKNVLHHLQTGKKAIQRKNMKLGGEIDMSAVFTGAINFLPYFIKEFNVIYPNVKINVRTGHSNQVLDMVLKNQSSFGISRSIHHPKFETIHLFKDQMVLAIYPGHPFQSHKTISIKDLTNEKFIQYARNTMDWTLVQNAFDRLNYSPDIIIEVDNIEVSKQMVKSGLGIAILPRSAIKVELTSGCLIEVIVSDLPDIQTNYDLIYLKDKTFDNLTNSFLNFLLKHSSHDTP